MTKKDEFDYVEPHAEHEKKEKVTTPEEVEAALDRYAEDYRGKSGVDPHDHPHFAKAKALIGKMKCH
jgi:hypothetical protein